MCLLSRLLLLFVSGSPEVNPTIDQNRPSGYKSPGAKLLAGLTRTERGFTPQNTELELRFLPVPYRRPLNRVGTLRACAVCVTR